MIKGITFDLDGVYFPNGKANFIKALGNFGISEDEAKRVFLKSDEMNNLYKLGKMTDKEFWSFAKKEWKTDKTWQELIGLMIQGYDTDENVVSVVKNLRQKGYKTLICTNNFPARVSGLQKRFGFLDNFDAHAFSYEVGAAKPSEVIFQNLINKSDLQPQEIVFTDDNEDNLNGAKSVGINVFLYRGFDDFLMRLKALSVNT